MDFSTTYLHKKLRSPLVVSANPLSERIDNIKRMEDAGAGAIVLYSLFEEQLRDEERAIHQRQTHDTGTYGEVMGNLPRPKYHTTSDAYLEHIRKAKEAVSIPIIASLNGSLTGTWTLFAQQIEQAGADGLELNLYATRANSNWEYGEIETNYLVTTKWVRRAVKIPVAVKLSPFFTNLAYFVHQLDEECVDALVLFNRFYQPDIDLEKHTLHSHLLLSESSDLRLPLRWIALLYGRVKAKLAATGGIHTGQDAIKALMAGASVTMMASALISRGIDHIQVVGQQIREWMEKHEYESVNQILGSLNAPDHDNLDEFERAQYMQALTTYLPQKYKPD